MAHRPRKTIRFWW